VTGRATTGFKVIRWIEQHCCFTNGEWIGRPFRLLPWQKELILGLFEVDGDRQRIKRWAYLSVAKKNGKTETAAALALYFLIGDDEPAAQVVCAAASDDQADLVFGAAKTMAELSPTLSQITECFERDIYVPSLPGARLRRLAAASGRLDGQNLHAVICDELHEWTSDKHEKVWTVLTNGTGARRQPMIVQITTAGYDLDTVCGRQYLLAKKTLHDPAVDRRYFAYIREAAEGADYTKPETWKAANPSFGVTVREDFFADQLSKKPEADFRRYFCNQWTRSRESWLPPGAWEDCQGDASIPDGAENVTLGVDVALFNDSTAVTTVHQRPDGRFAVTAKVWRPEGNSIDLGAVKAHIREQHNRYRLKAVTFDPAYFELVAAELGDEGIPMLRFPQTPSRMVPACQQAYELIVSGGLVHDGDPVLTDHVLSAARRESDKGWVLSKSRTKRKIDACIAMVIGLSIAASRTADTTSVYEARGLVTL